MQKTLYLLLWERWGRNGRECWETQDSLAAQTGASSRTIRRAQQAWIDAGWAAKVPPAGGQSKRLQLLHEPTQQPDTESGRTGQRVPRTQSPPDTESGTTGHSVPPNRTFCPPNRTESPVEPDRESPDSKEHKRTASRTARTARGAPPKLHPWDEGAKTAFAAGHPGAFDDPAVSELWDRWSQNCEDRHARPPSKAPGCRASEWEARGRDFSTRPGYLLHALELAAPHGWHWIDQDSTRRSFGRTGTKPSHTPEIPGMDFLREHHERELAERAKAKGGAA